MRLTHWAVTFALLLPLRAQETPHPNREGFLAIFPEPMPEGVTQIGLEATNQFLRPERQDSADGLTHGETAAALGCSETTVSWRVFAARRKLKRLLKDQFKREAGQ